MAALIAGRTASEMPGLDIAEQKSWQNFLDSTLRLYAMLNRRLTEVHQLSLFDVRVLDMLDNAPALSVPTGLPSWATRRATRPAAPDTATLVRGGVAERPNALALKARDG